jgi:hypothetical protein
VIKTLSRTLIAIAVFAASTAAACPPPPPPPPQDVGESDEAYAIRSATYLAGLEAQHQAWLHERQVRLWDEADSVFLARIERVQPTELYYWGDVQRVTLRPVRDAAPLKGRRYTNTFRLAYTEATSCGPTPSFAAIAGNVGDTYVVFVRNGRPHQRTVQQTIAPADITDERIQAALQAAESH